MAGKPRATHEDLSRAVENERKRAMVRSLDISFNELADMYSTGEIHIAPAYQRLFRWSTAKQSQFIESIILEMPLPPIYMVEVGDAKWELIDGGVGGMTDDLTALLAAIITRPADDTPRLAFADALDDRGEPGDAERAEFVRVQVELAGLECHHAGAGTDGEPVPWCRRCVLMRRERELWVAAHYGTDWFDRWTPTLGDPTGTSVPVARFVRGFVEWLILPAADWLAHADSLVWRPGQTEPCPHCEGGERLAVARAFGVSCRLCSATGSVPVPCPATAQPVTRVTLMTWPDADWQLANLPPEVLVAATGGGPHYFAADALKRRWPGVTFDLPAVPASWGVTPTTATPINDLRRFQERLRERADRAVRRIAADLAREHFPGQGPPRVSLDPPVGYVEEGAPFGEAEFRAANDRLRADTLDAIRNACLSRDPDPPG